MELRVSLTIDKNDNNKKMRRLASSYAPNGYLVLHSDLKRNFK